jgi:hypothetical protein
MAVAAVDAVAADMPFVTELDRLFPGDVRVGGICAMSHSRKAITKTAPKMLTREMVFVLG